MSTSNSVINPSTPNMSLLAFGVSADNIAQNTTNYANFPYADSDMAVLKSIGVTYIRIPIDICFLVPGLPMSGSSPVVNSTIASVTSAMAYVNSKIAQFTAAGFTCAPCVFVDNTLKDSTVSTGGLAAFNAMMLNAITVFANLWCNPSLPYKVSATVPYQSVYYGHTKLMLNLCNEPKYDDKSGTGYMYADWSNATNTGLMDQMIAAVRHVTKSHTIICDTVQTAKCEHITNQFPSKDTNVVYSVHVYTPTNLTGQGTTGFMLDPNYVYPREAIIPANGLTKYAGPFNGKKQKQFALTSFSGATIIRDYWFPEEYNTDDLDAYIKQARDWADLHKVNIIMGEFACSACAPVASRLAWVSDVITIAKKYNIPCSWWGVVGSKLGLRPHPNTIPDPHLQHNLATSGLDQGYDTDLLAIFRKNHITPKKV